MKKKKILLIYYVLFNPGGVARVMTNLANELVEQGHEVEILLLTSKFLISGFIYYSKIGF